MKILAIDTATECCSVALAEGDGVAVDQLTKVTSNEHSKLALGMVRELLEKHDMKLSALDAIAVDIGPGSFTGLRIGIGMAQGLAYGAGLPAFGISSLHALAAACPDGVSLTAIDARMKQVYWGIFEQREGAARQLAGPYVNSPLEVAPVLADLAQTDRLSGLPPDAPAFCIGSGWDQYRDQLPAGFNGISFSLLQKRMPQALQIAKLASGTPASAFYSPMHLAASYVRNEVATPPDTVQQST
ncbi:MAG: tRNA (adenosine(37)-N6)-threonylcarbamoyltransferase complex dimerization subunit type 1 TsaB [Gammaproteobacteria bacterium]